MTERAARPRRVAWRKFRRHTLSIYGGVILLLLYAAALLAGFLSPYHYTESARAKEYFWPTIVRWRDGDGRWTRPYVHNAYKIPGPHFEPHYVEARPENAPLIAERLEMGIDEVDTTRYPVRFLVRRPDANPDRRRPLGFLSRRGAADAPPMRLHLFGIDEARSPLDRDDPHFPMLFLLGSDHLGRDLFSRLLYGSRVSLSIGIVVVLITFSIGMLIGGISGYFGGTVDVVIQRICEMMMMVPGFYLLLALRSSFDPARMTSTQIYFAVVILLAIIGWAGMARVIRGMVLGVSRNEYVIAARALGAGNLRVIVRHVLPTTWSYAIVAATLGVPGAMLMESGLSFIGLGIQEPQASWGNMIEMTRNLVVIRWYPWLLAPGVMIFISIVAFQFLGDGLRDAFDPRSVISSSEGDGDDEGS